MAGLRFTIETLGDTIIDRELMRMGQRALEGEVLFLSLAEDFMNLEDEQFSSEGAFLSGGWAPLAESTVARKGHSTILFDTGQLRDSLTVRGYQGERGGMILDIGPDFLRFGTSDWVAPFHQKGTVNMPMRKVIELPEMWKQAMVKKVQLFIMRGEVVAL